MGSPCACPSCPGAPTTRTTSKPSAAFLVSLGIRRVELMPYHALGTDKYAALGRPYPLEGTKTPAPATLEACRSLLSTLGLACEVGGE